jgi:outer membrane protein assembly factor BamE
MIAFGSTPIKATHRPLTWAVWMCLGLCFLVSGCETASRTANRTLTALTPYRFDVVQGNFVAKEQVQLLQKGMSRRQVRDVLGTPLVASVFHANRWDYAFTLRRQGAEPQQRKVSVFFEGDTMVRFEADELPTEAEFAARIDNRRIDIKVPKLEASEAELSKFKPKGPVAPATSSEAPVSMSYPPLEPVQR